MKTMNIVRIAGMGVIALVFTVVMQACSSNGPTPINYGHEQCGHCRMTVSDGRFACQLVTAKGRAYTFDDVQCLIDFVKEGNVATEEVSAYYLSDYADGNQLLPARGLFLLKSESLKSPMRGDIAAFEKREDLEEVRGIIGGGEELIWDSMWK